LEKDVLLGKDVSERDMYGRLVRFVYADGLFVNLALVEEGFALAFEFEPDTSFSELFREATLQCFLPTAGVKGVATSPNTSNI
jgi:endonuclease YncB( thermonuclease family)